MNDKMKATIFIIALYVIVAPLVILLLSFLFKLNFVVMLTSFITFRVCLYICDKIIEKW